MAKNLGFHGPNQTEAADQIKKLYKLFEDVDATQVEINPFGETTDGKGLNYLEPYVLIRITNNH